jgi:hypothetical protein
VRACVRAWENSTPFSNYIYICIHMYMYIHKHIYTHIYTPFPNVRPRLCALSAAALEALLRVHCEFAPSWPCCRCRGSVCTISAEG